MSAEPMTADPESTRAARITMLSVSANACLVVAKLLGGIFGHSHALIADAVESMLDIAGSLIIWSGVRISAIPPDINHPYGHGKAEPVAVLAMAVSLLAAAVGLSMLSVQALYTPHPPPQAFTLVVVCVAIISKELLFRMVSKVGNAMGSTALRADATHHRLDALTSLVAFLGIAISLIGGPEYANADSWAALAACALIAFNGHSMLKPALEEIMDTAPSPDIEAHVRELAVKVEGVAGVEQCRVRKYGIKFIVDLHVEVDGNLTVYKGHEIAHRVKDKLLKSDLRIGDVLVHIEPFKP